MHATEVTFATFNVSMEAQNYLPEGQNVGPAVLAELLQTDSQPQIRNIANIIQLVRPDVLLLNEFDYIADSDKGIKAFIKNYLNRPQGTAEAINYPYFYYNTVNTGQPSPCSGSYPNRWRFARCPSTESGSDPDWDTLRY